MSESAADLFDLESSAARPPRSPATRHDSVPVTAFDIENLSVYYGVHQALRSVSFSVRAKTVTAIIGPSGCGKSTLLKTLNLLLDLQPEVRVEGQIRYFGTKLLGGDLDPASLRRRVGMIFPKPNPFPMMSIAENVTVGLRLNRFTNRELMEERLEQSLRRANLWDEVKDRLGASPLHLSSGQQQRLCVARALAMNPEVLLLDEPAATLDPIGTGKIEDTIMRLRKELTLIIVTHNLQQASRISEETAFLFLGELVEHGTTGRIFTSPKKKQTEDYVTGRFG